MRIELKITYEGSEQGLSENRLSLSSFGPSLALLLKALQRTASGIVSNALGDPEYGSKGGKLATDAKLLDLELERLDEGSAVPVFVCSTRTPNNGQMPIPFGLMGPDLAETAIVQVLNDIDAESSGRARNHGVRDYLSSLPPGVTKQRYTAMRDGVLLKDVSFAQSVLPTMPAPMPRIRKVVGTIISVGFEPGTPFIKIKTHKVGSMRIVSTPQQVETAINLRGHSVVVAILEGEASNLIWIRRADEEKPIPPIEDTVYRAYARWGRTLEILAK